MLHVYIMTQNLKDAKAALKDMLHYMLYLFNFVDDDLERWFATWNIITMGRVFDIFWGLKMIRVVLTCSSDVIHGTFIVNPL